MNTFTFIISLLLLALQATSIPTGKHIVSSSDNPQFRGSYICETTPGSPTIPSINGAIQVLDDLAVDKMCKQYNQHIGGSHCTRLSRSNDADIGICGDHHESQWVMCYMVAHAAKVIRENCGWNGLAGGEFWFDGVPKCSIIVYHS